jgi:hypothetical protein
MAGTSDDGTGADGPDDTREPARPDAPGPPPDAESTEGWRKRWQDRMTKVRDQARDRAKEWWPKIQPLLTQLRWTDEPPPTMTIIDRRVSPALLVPAQGQVYGFVIRATFTWTADLTRPELFGWYVDYFQPQADQRLRRIAARYARESPPHRPRDVEIALYEAFAGEDALPWRYERGDVLFSCELDVSVHLDERVRRLLQPYWDRRIALECERDLDRRRAEYAEERRRRGPAETTEQDGPTTAGTPGADRTERPPHQREATAHAGDAPRRPDGQRRRRPRPDSPVEQFTPLEPFPPQPAAPPPRPGRRPRPATAGETVSGDPENPGPPDA